MDTWRPRLRGAAGVLGGVAVRASAEEESAGEVARMLFDYAYLRQLIRQLINE